MATADHDYGTADDMSPLIEDLPSGEEAPECVKDDEGMQASGSDNKRSDVEDVPSGDGVDAAGIATDDAVPADDPADNPTTEDAILADAKSDDPVSEDAIPTGTPLDDPDGLDDEENDATPGDGSAADATPDVDSAEESASDAVEAAREKACEVSGDGVEPVDVDGDPGDDADAGDEVDFVAGNAGDGDDAGAGNDTDAGDDAGNDTDAGDETGSADADADAEDEVGDDSEVFDMDKLVGAHFAWSAPSKTKWSYTDADDILSDETDEGDEGPSDEELADDGAATEAGEGGPDAASGTDAEPATDVTTEASGDSAPDVPDVTDTGDAPEEAPAEEFFEPIITERVPSYDEEHGRAIGESYRQDFSRFERAYQPEPEREIKIPHIADEDGAGYRVPGEGKSRSKVRPVLAFLLVALMVGGIVAAGTYGFEIWGGKSLPNVVGLSEKQAREELEARGFAVKTTTEIADDGIGYVLDQKPQVGTRIEEGSRVEIVVASNRVMPEVLGLPQAEAENKLHEAGAGEIKVQLVNSKEEEGSVIAVKPEVGKSFTAHQTITLSVAAKPVVPDVVGKNKVEAVAVLENAGFIVETQTVESDKQQNTVVEQNPAANTKIDPDTAVVLKLAQPKKKTGTLSLISLLGKSSPDLAKELVKDGFSFNSGHATGDGYGEAEYVSSRFGRIIFCERPFSHRYEQTGKEDVLTNGLKYRGVRWEVPASMYPAGTQDLTTAAAESLMSTCGLSNPTEVCTQDDIVIPDEAAKTGAKFRCLYGETDKYSWTVLLTKEKNDSPVRAVVTCAPKSLYEEWYDLEPYGYSVCDMIAYADVYTELS